MKPAVPGLLALFACTLAVPALAQEEPAVHAPDQLQWSEIAPGISIAPAFGDMTKEAHGKFFKFQPGASVVMHTHTGGYHGVLISGSLTNAYPGDEDPTPMAPGTHWYVPGGALHANACVSEEPCLLYTHADAAFDFTPAAE